MHSCSRRQRRSAQQVQELLDAFRSSGLSQAAFSRLHGISQSFLSLRLKKLGIKSTPAPTTKSLGLLEVELPLRDTERYRIAFQSGLQLEVPRQFDPSELSALIRVVAAAEVQSRLMPA